MNFGRMPAVAIVCAKNEAPRIGRVLSALVPKIPTLVVNDGSTDDTAYVAQDHGARVLNLPRNLGKGQAMLAGVNAVPNADTILFADADLVGFRPEYVDRLLSPVLNGNYGMIVGMRDYGPQLESVIRRLPLISGERAVRRSLLVGMPAEAWRGFAVETWMNHVVAQSGQRIGTVLLPGTSVVLKWDKGDEGLAPRPRPAEGGNAGLVPPQAGFEQMVTMGAEVVEAHVRAAGYPSTAPLPASLTARKGTSQDVMRALSQTLVETGGPYVRQHLWTPDAQQRVGDAIGRRLSMPLWSIAYIACAGFFGPTVGLAAALGALAYNHRAYLKGRQLI